MKRKHRAIADGLLTVYLRLEPTFNELVPRHELPEWIANRMPNIKVASRRDWIDWAKGYGPPGIGKSESVKALKRKGVKVKNVKLRKMKKRDLRGFISVQR